MSLFTRRIEIEADDAGDGKIRIDGKLFDTRLSVTLHVIEARMLVSVADGTVLSVGAAMPEIPMDECRQGIAALDEIMGAQIKPGFTEFVRQTVGSQRGCTHLASLIVNMGNVSVQARGAYLRKYVPEGSIEESAYRELMEKNVAELGLLNSCVCWREDGPIVRRWREREKQE